MKKRALIPLILLLTLFLSSCELIVKQNPKPTINFVSVALNYASSSMGTLNYTLPDQEGMELQLEAMCQKAGYKFHSYKYTEDKGKYYFTNDGTKTEITSTSDCSSKGLKPEVWERLEDNTLQTDSDILIFYYSGHGVNDGSMVMSGTENEDRVRMSPDELYSLIKSQRGKKLILLDSCYSGTIVTDTEGTLSKDDIFSDGWSTLFGKEASNNDNIWAMTAAQSDNESFEFEYYGHGLFSYYLLKGLGATDPRYNVAGTSSSLYSMDGELTVAELYDFVDKHVSTNSANQSYSNYYPPKGPQVTQNATSVLDLVLFKF